MPVKIGNAQASSVRDRIDAFRHTIPDDVGYTSAELQHLPGAAFGNERRILGHMNDQHWFITRWVGGRKVKLLVNPKTLKKYAPKAD